MNTEDRELLAELGMLIITEDLTEEDIKELVIEEYLELRERVSASQLESDLIDTIASLYSILAVREATISAMTEVIEELE